MKFESIRPKQKLYYKRCFGHKGDKQYKVDIAPVYVLDVDYQKQRALASIGGAPAEWFSHERATRWLEKNPQLKKNPKTPKMSANAKSY